MSIVQSLKRLFDPIEYRREHAELKRKAEARHDDGQPDPPRPAQRFRCRICEREGHDRYCRACLAETMDAIEPR